MQAADAIEKRHGNLLFNPLGFLAQSVRPKMKKMTPHGKTEPDSFAVSDEVSRANIAILSVLLSELLQHYKDQSKELSEFMNGPLKPIVSDWHNTLPAMKSFVRGSQMDLTQKGTLNEPPLPSRHRPCISTKLFCLHSSPCDSGIQSEYLKRQLGSRMVPYFHQISSRV